MFLVYIEYLNVLCLEFVWLISRKSSRNIHYWYFEPRAALDIRMSRVLLCTYFEKSCSSNWEKHHKSLYCNKGPLKAVDQSLKWRLLFSQTHVNWCWQDRISAKLIYYASFIKYVAIQFRTSAQVLMDNLVCRFLISNISNVVFKTFYWWYNNKKLMD